MAEVTEEVIDIALLDATRVRMFYEQRLDRRMAEWQAHLLDRLMIDKCVKEARRG